ncbi:MAG: right-handed parallel beta-helix repeat-containing protein [Lewinellaceae bacterium]|nr:right-handed parallel beta-helix repeat-containing protein [Lewinellaceae bacterium]
MKKTPCIILFLLLSFGLSAATHHVGNGQTYANLSAAVAITQPGDTIIIHGGTYAGGLTINNLKGTANQWITIRNAVGETVVFEGGGNAIQFVEPAYLHIIGLIFQHQTGNGVNTDDGGTYDTPAHHVVFENCVFRDMSASGNNDLLKLSGLDYFEIRNCEFRNGATGGSGIDMVGCHHGIIQGNFFENLGSNSIQCKGGTEHVRIEGNFFRNGGQRTLNIGGSTGLQFFRPDTAHFEAARIQVYSNIIVGSGALIAYVGGGGGGSSQQYDLSAAKLGDSHPSGNGGPQPFSRMRRQLLSQQHRFSGQQSLHRNQYWPQYAPGEFCFFQQPLV